MSTAAIALGKGFEKVSIRAFREKILPDVFQKGQLLAHTGSDLVEFGLRTPALQGQAPGFFRKHWETLVFALRKTFFRFHTDLTKKYGDFMTMEKLPENQGGGVLAENRLGLFVIEKTGNKKYMIRVGTLKTKAGKPPKKEDVNVKTHENVPRHKLPFALSYFMGRHNIP